jgi:hypothetical protein
MNSRSTHAIASAILIAVGLARPAMATPPYPLAPLYNPAHPTPYDPQNFSPAPGGNINLTTVPPATTVVDADQKFGARTAAAIALAAGGPLPTDASDNGEGYQSTLLATWAYPEYFNADPYRTGSTPSIQSHSPGLEGTAIELPGTTFGASGHDEYDFTLNYYMPLIYRYYQDLANNGVADYMINTLIGKAALSGIPSGRSAVGNLSTTWSEYIHVPAVIDFPETENHLLGIVTANYLGNQLLYQRTQNLAYDNLRNGDPGNGAPRTTDLLLSMLQGFLKNDFQEYNGRPYQDISMSALLNLASYAYDDRVRLAARMVLDYVSVKIAVSSEDLRRAPPFRRRNELQHYGPTIDGNFLGSPLAVNFGSANGSPYEPDPQIAYYSLLAGNTGIFFSPAVTSTGLSIGSVPANYNWEMVHAGLCDYRIPPSILDLFITRQNRRFYQYFHHGSGRGEFADELYAGSPSYLISAGGRPTTYVYRADVKVGAQALLDALALYTGGLGAAVLEPLVLDAANGSSADLGAAMPTLFLPADQGFTLSDIIQFGEYTTDESKSHLCVAPDFACGDNIYLPPAIANDPGNVTNGNWLFVNRGGTANTPGYYLAIYTVDNGNGGRAGLLEAYDTWRSRFLTTLTFPQFMANVQAANPSLNLQLGNNQPNSYVTQSGQSITFSISPRGQILSTTEMSPAPASNPQFTAGTILNSTQGSGLVVISNPALGTSVTLDMRDLNNISRTDEDGTVEYGGGEVWVNFNYGGNQGDFAQPFRSLRDATKAFASAHPPRVFKIIAGSEHESITINQPVTLTAVGGQVEIIGQ